LSSHFLGFIVQTGHPPKIQTPNCQRKFAYPANTPQLKTTHTTPPAQPEQHKKYIAQNQTQYQSLTININVYYNYRNSHAKNFKTKNYL
jgi:hypothetical protein